MEPQFMKRINFTTATINGLTPGTVRYEVGDLKVPTLVLRIGPRAKSWSANLKRHGRRYRVDLGRFPEVGVAEARIAAVKAAADVLSDKHIEVAVKRKGAMTFGEAFAEYLARVDNAATRRNYESCFRVHLVKIHRYRLDAISAEIVSDLHREISTRSPSKANLSARLIRAVLNFQRRRGAVTLPDPTTILSHERKWNTIARKVRAVPARSVPDFIQRVETLNVIPTSASEATLFALYSGCRISEVLNLKWSDVDLVSGSFRLTETKSGRPATLPLINQTEAIVRRRMKSLDRNPVYLFPSPVNKERPIVDVRNIFERLEADGFGTYSAHDLRRGFAAALDATGAGSFAIRRLLNHSLNADSDVTAGYITSELSTLRKFAQAAGDFLSKGGDDNG
jgi:integrase